MLGCFVDGLSRCVALAHHPCSPGGGGDTLYRGVYNCAYCIVKCIMYSTLHDAKHCVMYNDETKMTNYSLEFLECWLIGCSLSNEVYTVECTYF